MGDAAMAAQIGQFGDPAQHEVQVGEGCGHGAGNHHLPHRRPTCLSRPNDGRAAAPCEHASNKGARKRVCQCIHRIQGIAANALLVA